LLCKPAYPQERIDIALEENASQQVGFLADALDAGEDNDAGDRIKENAVAND
jgi:hypothetical protein